MCKYPTCCCLSAVFDFAGGFLLRIVDLVNLKPDFTISKIVGSPGPCHPDPEANALASAALAFFHSRASSPRDLSAAAAQELRAGCLAVLKAMYS